MISRIKIYLFVLGILISFNSKAQRRYRNYSESYYAIGAEVNPIPYLSGGYSGTLWWGFEQVRISGSAAYTLVPGFLISNIFEQNKIRSYALLGDYYFEPAFKNLWAGGGFEYWQGSVINSDDKTMSKYVNYVVTIRAGYVIKFWRDFYVNPSGSIHLVVGGEKVIETGNATFNSNTIYPDISIKIGYHFRL